MAKSGRNRGGVPGPGMQAKPLKTGKQGSEVARRGGGRGKKRRRDDPPSRRRKRGRRAHVPVKLEPVQQAVPVKLEPIQSVGSIHRAWKQPLGGLIRHYANVIGDVAQANNNVEQMYAAHGCDVTKTRDAIIHALAPTMMESGDGTGSNEWIGMNVGIETEGERGMSKDELMNAGIHAHETMSDGQGIKLQTQKRPAEGPAHAGETWNIVLIEPWAIGKSYYFDITNRSPLNLSCVMTIDGHKELAAKNSPLLPHETRTLRPDGARYYQTHQWVFQTAERISLNSLCPYAPKREQQPQTTRQQPNPRTGKRYNGKRPDYKGERISLVDFPDPTNFGWIFTGSVEASRVEFFAKQMNFGVVLMDFYYTTGTVKTTLDHPTTGKNQLFRKCGVSPEMYKKILENPRAHTNVGYRRSGQVSHLAESDGENESMETDQEERPQNAVANNGVDDSEAPNLDVPFPAKNDDYDFGTEGHKNRKESMARLRNTRQYRAWEESEKKDWACIHAKFYVSLPQTRKRKVGRQRKSDKQECVPAAAATVPDIKSAENATLATKFHVTGQSRPRMTSRVRMEVIKGLKDDPEWGSGPVFEYKLYYRTKDVKEYSDVMEDDYSDEVPLAETMPTEASLEAYKVDITQQLNGLHRDNMSTDIEEADNMLTNCTSKIQAARDFAAIDVTKATYFDWYRKQPWAKING